MLVVRGTKKLRDKVKGAPSAAADDAATTVLGDWFATALFWKPQVVMLVSNRTFLPVFMPLAPAATLLDRIPAAIAEVLDRHGIPAKHIEAELAEMSDVRLAPTNDRQVLGVMNEFALQADHQRDDADTDLVALSLDLSEVILGPLMKREGRPVDELAVVFAPDAKIIPFPTAHDAAAHDAAAGELPSPKPVSPRGPRRKVHQLKVTLRDIRPPVWRRVVVDGSETLDHLHDVLQAAFGWYDAHLHVFDINGARYGAPGFDDWDPVKDEQRTKIDRVIGAGRFRYTYDFGDNWEHNIVVEKTFAASDDAVPATVPDCIGGRRACPPEDCGGPWGYGDLLQILADPGHPEHAERVEWLGQPFDPEAFDASSFADDLDVQLNMAFGDDDW